MPYHSDKIGHKGNTPDGCRSDNGRALSSIDWNYSRDYIAFGIGGGTYYVKGTGLGEIFALLTNRWDPGCAWNYALGWNSPKSGLTKDEPHNDPDSDIWIFARPPDYKPVAFV